MTQQARLISAHRTQRRSRKLNATISNIEAPRAYRIPDACRALGIGRSSLYKLASTGRLRLVRIGGRTVVPGAEIARLANEGTR